jgi:uncharacterized protein (DUF1800 family)
MSETATFIALNRFGLGPRPGEWARVASDPRGWLRDQVSDGAVDPVRLERTSRSPELVALMERKGKGGVADKRELRNGFLARYRDDVFARTRAQIRSVTPFRERLVAFWSNHFTVSILRPVVLGLVGPFEWEAIRPHVTGRFIDMLSAAIRHPAMLLYLDNVSSVGPNSPAGRRREAGLNENLARELLELHTLGVDGGYTQADIVNLARVLTGWSVSQPGAQGGAGRFVFRERAHEPGPKTVLNATYAAGGEADGHAVLKDLSRHPATARHIATKLARHFVADDPPEAAVARLAQVFGETEGDLGAVSRALVELPEAWADPLVKIKSGNDLLVSTMRALEQDEGGDRVLAQLRDLGQPPFAAPSPEGWPDRADDWIGPEALLRRVEWAGVLAGRLATRIKAVDFLDATVGAIARPATRFAVTHAASAAEGLALVLLSPEFQRR